MNKYIIKEIEENLGVCFNNFNLIKIVLIYSLFVN